MELNMLNHRKTLGLVAISLLALALPIQSVRAKEMTTLADTAEYEGSIAGFVANCLTDYRMLEKLKKSLDQAPPQFRPLMESHSKLAVQKGMVEHEVGFSDSWERLDCKEAGKLKELQDALWAKHGIR